MTRDLIRFQLDVAREAARRGLIDNVIGIAECIADAGKAGDEWRLLDQARAMEAMCWHAAALVAWVQVDAMARAATAAMEGT